MMEVARGQCYGACEVGGMTKRQEERNARHAEAEDDDVDIVWVGRQEGGAACAEDIDTIAEDSVEKTAAWAVPSANGNMDNLVVASCSAAWAGRAFHVCDDHQASASAHKAGLTRDSYSLETWQRLPRPHDDIGPREVNDRRGSAYQVLNSPADDSWLTKRTLFGAKGEGVVFGAKMRIHAFSGCGRRLKGEKREIISGTAEKMTATTGNLSKYAMAKKCIAGEHAIACLFVKLARLLLFCSFLLKLL
jgi:hypothetical protein